MLVLIYKNNLDHLLRLYKDIVAQYEKERESEDFNLRDVQHYLKVFCYIISVVREVESGKDYEEKTVIENMLNNDNSLFSYTFFVSSRSQFDYSWSYLRKQWNEYSKTLNSACKFILDMIDKVNVLYEHRSEFIANEFVFADIFVLSFAKATYLPHIEIKWENINSLFNVDNSYHISAKIGDAVQMTIKICLDKPDNTDSFLSLFAKWNGNECGKDDENNK